MVFQTDLQLPSHPRGFHLITHYIEEALSSCDIATGIAHLFIQHTSAALTINENADPTVRTDFESHFNQMVPETAPYFIHTYEGPDDSRLISRLHSLVRPYHFPLLIGCHTWALGRASISVNIATMVAHAVWYSQSTVSNL